jgi:hypothetical protein
MPDRRRLAGLAGPPEDERLAVFPRRPGGEDGIDLPREVQGDSLLWREQVFWISILGINTVVFILQASINTRVFVRQPGILGFRRL